MHSEILTRHQEELLPLIRQFKREFYLVGGTAIALHIGHRRSVDFDLFKKGPIRHRSIIDKIAVSGYEYLITRRVSEQMNRILNEISARAVELFGQMFSEKLFRAQLCYFEDIDYTEEVEYLLDPVPEAEIREFLIGKAVEIF